MKRFISCLVVLMALGFFAGNPSVLRIQNVRIPTNNAVTSAVISTNDAGALITGWLEGFYFKFTGTNANATCKVDIVTGDIGGMSTNRSLFMGSNVLTDTFYSIRDIPVGIAMNAQTNDVAKIPLVIDQLKVKAYSARGNAGSTGGISLDTYIIISH